MRRLLIFFLLAMMMAGHPVAVWAQGVAVPSPEAFVNAVFHTVVDTSFSHYYLIKGADTCRFIKYDYDEWTKYYLRESVPIQILNELAEKAYLSRYVYYWKQDSLRQAVCISSKQADSIFSLANPALDKKTNRAIMREWQQLPAQEKTVFSFSLPQFTDDGQYAVIDLNIICGALCGSGLTCLFRHTAAGWKLIGQHVNWSS